MSLFLPAPFVTSGLSYAAAIAAITNKSIYVYGDSYGGSNGTALTTTNWTNSGSAGGAFSATSGSVVWETNSQNGMPGVKNAVNNAWLTRAIDYNTLHGTNGAMTVFAVEKRTGSQGTSTGDTTYTNGGIFGDVSNWVGHYYITRAVAYYKYTGNNQSSALSYTDGAAFVTAIRINTSGHYRVNFNGSSVYLDTTSRTAPSTSAGNIFLLKNLNTSNNYGYEYIVTADVLADGLVDQIVIALKKKWGIT